MPRTFVAVAMTPTPPLRKLHERLSALDARYSLVALANLHVTVKFLGDTPESLIAPIAEVLKREVESRRAFQVRLYGVGSFPSQKRPTVVWVGVDRADPLCHLAADLDRKLIPLGLAPEHRAFSPHLTLLRIKSRPPEALFAVLSDEAQTDFGLVAISRVQLFQSELSRSGPKYTSLATAALSSTS